MVYPYDVNYNGTIYKAGENVPEKKEKLDIPFYDDESEETETEYVSESKNKRGRKPKNKVFDEWW